MPIRSVARSLLVALMLASSLGLARADDATRMTIETTGEGAVSAKPDFATVTIGVHSGGRLAQSALAENSRAVAAVVVALKSAGVDAKDIQTADFSIWPQDEGRLGFNVSNRVTVTVRDLARLEEALDKAAAGKEFHPRHSIWRHQRFRRARRRAQGHLRRCAAQGRGLRRRSRRQARRPCRPRGDEREQRPGRRRAGQACRPADRTWRKPVDRRRARPIRDRALARHRLAPARARRTRPDRP